MSNKEWERNKEVRGDPNCGIKEEEKENEWKGGKYGAEKKVKEKGKEKKRKESRSRPFLSTS